MNRQEQAFSQLMDWLGDLPSGYVLINNLGEIKAISAILREHMRTVDATLDSLRQDLSLKLKLKEHGYRIKVINSEAQPVLGIASVELTLGLWSGKCNLMAVLLDDFDLMLGKEFMAMNKIFPIPHLDV
ncbi:hypothetical protein ACH5RR_018444 [Cinchona calisaya]|uniref:Uncharacterized protein n=1 Tax=Cinchona calisaya TaxID=153742 RepID=A0ABD2ZLH5_9GENT